LLLGRQKPIEGITRIGAGLGARLIDGVLRLLSRLVLTYRHQRVTSYLRVAESFG
jgi:hypothetical protein